MRWPRDLCRARVASIAHAYLCNARHCYLRWGALGKVRQLERLNPWLAGESVASVLSATINAPVEQLDVGAVVKASQAMSGEIELGKLTETLLRIASSMREPSGACSSYSRRRAADRGGGDD